MTARERTAPDVATLKRLLAGCWSRGTSSRWSEETPSRGQCGVTALVLHDHFGGEILKTRVGDAWHYYNRFAGVPADATADQFAAPIAYLDAVATRDEAFADTNEQQYQELSRRFAAALESARAVAPVVGCTEGKHLVINARTDVSHVGPRSEQWT